MADGSSFARNHLLKFKRDKYGTIAMVAALTLPIVIMVVGGAVDFLRWHSAKADTAAALDAAVLAGARTLLLTGEDGLAIAAAQAYYHKNVLDRYDVTSDSVAFSVGDGGTSITGTGTASLPTSFLNLAGIESLMLTADPAAGFPTAKITSGGGGNLEVSLMLDLTGSMCDDGEGPCTTGTKIDALKIAAKDLVDIVVRPDQSNYTSRVALVPFSKRIRIAPNGEGAAVMKQLTNLDPTWSGWYKSCTESTSTSGGAAGTEGGGSGSSCTVYTPEYVTDWKIRPCITDRFYDNPPGMDLTDDLPGPGRWMNAYEGRRTPVSLDSANNAPANELGLTQSDPSTHYNWDQSGGCSTYQTNQVVPLSADIAALNLTIDGLTADSVTAGALGTAFTWYMLSPNWSSIWQNSEPAGSYSELSDIQPNNVPVLRKVAIIMSDGVYNTYRSWKNQDQQEVSNYAKQLCSNMKAKGIEIYAVAFELDQLGAAERVIAEDTLRSCGSDIEHFYNSLTPEDLQSAFRDIAIKLSMISLVR